MECILQPHPVFWFFAAYGLERDAQAGRRVDARPENTWNVFYNLILFFGFFAAYGLERDAQAGRRVDARQGGCARSPSVAGAAPCRKPQARRRSAALRE
jgi:hypothetical protein